MRGKVLGGKNLRVVVGITPAHAGKSPVSRVRMFSTWDHPRACGEKRSLLNMGFDGKGSPPRMRGKEKNAKKHDKTQRITPAHAGKSDLCAYAAALNRDHPRACGEKLRRRTVQFAGKGSPPRMRGKAGFYVRE